MVERVRADATPAELTRESETLSAQTIRNWVRQANRGTRVQRTGTSNGNGSLPLGAQIEIASEAAFRSCAAEMLGAANRG